MIRLIFSGSLRDLKTGFKPNPPPAPESQCHYSNIKNGR
jgi:hypothetical protein